jgi:hypothetical protein
VSVGCGPNTKEQVDVAARSYRAARWQERGRVGRHTVWSRRVPFFCDTEMSFPLGSKGVAAGPSLPFIQGSSQSTNRTGRAQTNDKWHGVRRITLKRGGGGSPPPPNPQPRTMQEEPPTLATIDVQAGIINRDTRSSVAAPSVAATGAAQTLPDVGSTHQSGFCVGVLPSVQTRHTEHLHPPDGPALETSHPPAPWVDQPC